MLECMDAGGLDMYKYAYVYARQPTSHVPFYTPPPTSHLSPLTSHLSPLTSHLSPLTAHPAALTLQPRPLLDQVCFIPAINSCRALFSSFAEMTFLPPDPRLCRLRSKSLVSLFLIPPGPIRLIPPPTPLVPFVDVDGEVDAF